MQSDIIAKVITAFPYLFERYGYQVIAYKPFTNSGNWLVVLESVSCGRFLVLQDTGEIIVALAPPGSPENATDSRWFDMAVIVEYLSEGEHMLADQLDDQDRELVRLAAQLKPYMDRVCNLFLGPVFESASEELDRIGRRREDELASRTLWRWEGDGDLF